MSPKILILVVLLLAGVTTKSTPQSRIKDDFCWKDSYGRGVGKIPDHCASDQDRIGLLCYPKCPHGYYRWGFDCHQYCPGGWSDQGLFCRLSEYGRGTGYAWHFGDGFHDSGMIRRCEAQQGVGNCQKWGAMYYPKCKRGYHPFGCCICRPPVPNCADYGMNSGIDLSCAKKIIFGTPLTGRCYDNEEKDGGLCYPKCSHLYNGIGPVCWGINPQGWITCGMGAATTSEVCTDIILDQIMSIGKMAFDLATLGAQSAGSQEFQNLDQLRDGFQNLRDRYEQSKQISHIVNAAKDDSEYSNIASESEKIRSTPTDTAQPEDIVRISSSIAALVDPTGIAGTISAFSYPTCSKIFGAYSAADTQKFKEHNFKKAEKRFLLLTSQKSWEEQNEILGDVAIQTMRRIKWLQAHSNGTVNDANDL